MNTFQRAATLLLLTATGCAGTVEVTRTFTPDSAAQAQNEKLVPVAVVRGSERIALPAGARVEDNRVVFAGERLYVHKLTAGDVVEQNALGQIVAVRSAGDPPIVTHFAPGTATSPAGSDEVRGRAMGTSALALKRGDGIEMHGQLAPNDVVPGGGRVESSRATGALVAGIVLMVISYAPTAYVGAGSHRAGDRVLEVPVAGPWLDLAQRPACVPPSSPIKLPIDPCLMETASRAALVTSGAVQGLATLLSIVGLPSHAQLVDDADRGVGRRRETVPHVVMVPSPGGATLVGTF